MSRHVVSPAFVDDVERFDGTASQVARLRAKFEQHDNDRKPESPHHDHHLPPRRGGHRTWDRFLLWLAGVNYELASRSYVDRTRHATIGFAVLMTAFIAGVSFFLVLSSAGVNSLLSTLAAALWATLMITLERSLVASATRRFSNRSSAFVTTVVGLVFATLLSGAVAQPLTLRIFQPEIEQQIQATRLQESQAFYTSQTGGGRIRELQAALATNAATTMEAEQRLACETSGTCGTGVKGTGAETAILKAELDKARAEQSRLLAEYDLTQRQVAAASEELNQRPVGFLAQLRAFNDVSKHEPLVSAASMILTGGLILVQMLPQLLVLLTRRRGTTLYEKLLAIEERYAEDEHELDAIRRAGARRLADETDPKVDDVLRRFEEQRDEIGQRVRDTYAAVIQLEEERVARRTG